jgi:hypothetical protein
MIVQKRASRAPGVSLDKGLPHQRALGEVRRYQAKQNKTDLRGAINLRRSAVHGFERRVRHLPDARHNPRIGSPGELDAAGASSCRVSQGGWERRDTD